MCEKPFMASGKVVRDYTPLMKFLNSLPEDVRREILPSSDDLLRLKGLIKGGADLHEVIEELARTFRGRLAPHGKLARKALKEAWGVDASEEYALDELSRELAGWVIEMGEGLGYLSIRRGKPD